MERKRSSYLTVSQIYTLNVVCKPIAECYGYGVYHVGSSLTRMDWRDVDLRCIMPDQEFDVMFPDNNNGPKKLKLLNVVISDWIAARTSLPIDFQFQRSTEANQSFPGPRNPVGLV